jgi:predicted GNAT family acetyltransferase
LERRVLGSLGRFCIESHPDCFLSYELENKVINMNHTFVNEDLRGKGFGAILVDKALEFAEQEGIGDKFVGEDIVFFRKLKEAGIPLYAHTGALVRHMKRFSLDADYYSLYWSWQTLKKQIEQDKP